MEGKTLAWAVFGFYLVVTSGLAWMGHKKTDSLESFALGKRDMGPWLVGITMAASMASTATFIINPGFVYTHGLAAFMHFGVAIFGGIAIALFTLSPGFRKHGVSGEALSLPHWIGSRFGSPGLRIFFGAVMLLSITFVVLIVGGVKIMLVQTLGLGETAALALTVGFVFSYILVGGTYAHAYTNTLQGIMMVIVSLAIAVKTGGVLVDGGFWAKMSAEAPNLLAAVNPESNLFSSVFSVYVAGVVVGFAVVCQPHLLMKALYLKEDKDVSRYIQVSLLVTAIFFSLLLAGLAAHAVLEPGAVSQDKIMAAFLAKSFSETTFVFISVALVAAGMSTLDGILVAMSTIASNDLFLPLAERTFMKNASPEARAKRAYRFGQGVLIAMGLGAFLICLDQPKFLGIFGQVGVYGILAAAVGPVLLGVRGASGREALPVAVSMSLTGAGVHFALYLGGFDPNPGVTATWGIIASAIAGAVAHGVTRGRVAASDVAPVAE
jgi:SSS family solute:Na+ symporter/sodium/pantothenate symporter